MLALKPGFGSALLMLVVILAGCGSGGSPPASSRSSSARASANALQRLRAENLALRRRKAGLQRRLRAQRGTAAAGTTVAPGRSGVGGSLFGAHARASFTQLQARIGGQIGVTVSGAGRSSASETLGSLTSGVAWSTIKVPVAIAARRANVGDSGAVTRAITESDNAAAESLWSSLGSGAQAASAVQAVLRDGGDGGTVVNPTRTRPGFTAFGQTVWPLEAQERFVAALPCVGDSGPVLQLMREVVPGQRWGLGSTSLPAAFKGGWGPDLSGHYLVRQMGLLTLPNGRPLAIALIAQPSSGDFGAGTAALTRLATWTAAHVNANAVPAQRC